MRDGLADGRKFAKKRKQARQCAELLAAAVDLEPDDTPANFPEKIPKNTCEELCRRIEGYLRGWFRNGIPCVLAAELKRRFAKRTGYSWRHVHFTFTHFQKWSTNFSFKRSRLGRSTCIVIALKVRPVVVSTAEVRRRLVGAIRRYVRKGGAAYVDRKFLENFHSRFGLPPEQIFYAWRTLYRVDDFVCSWKGQGNGKIFVVRTPANAARKTAIRQKAGLDSLTQSSSGISPPTGGKDRKTTAAPERLPNESSGSLRSHGRPGVAGRDFRGKVTADRSPTADGEDFQRPYGNGPPRGTRPKPPGNDRAFHRWRARGEPLHVCDRWIGPAKLARKTNFIVFQVIGPTHAAFPLVEWRQGYAWNYANAALRAGFLDSEICAAYRTGLEQSQRDVMREDGAPRLSGREREDGSWETVWQRDPRVPSQTVAIAWRILRADERSDEDRWRAFFRGEVAPAGAALKPPAVDRASVTGPGENYARASRAAELPPAPGPARQYLKKDDMIRHRETGVELRVTYAGEAGFMTSAQDGVWAWRHAEQFSVVGRGPRDPLSEVKRAAAKLPDTAPALTKFHLRAEPATFEEHLKAAGLTLDSLLKMPRAEQQKFVRQAQKRQRDNSQKG